MNAIAAHLRPVEIAHPLQPDTVISAREVAKVFNQDVIALEGASFDIRRGSFVSLVGPSGCGKSTLLRLVAGLIGKSSGNLSVLGNAVDGPSADVGMMFQRPTLLEWRTAVENVLLPTEVKGTPTPSDKQRAIELLRMVGLKDFEFSFPRQLSGGMQQRVAIARALAEQPRLLLMDEPFGALDEITRERMQNELVRICAETGAAVLFVTHSIPEAVFLSDRVVVMSPRPGRITGIVDVRADGLVPAHDRSAGARDEEGFFRAVGEVRSLLHGTPEPAVTARGVDSR